MVDVGHVGRLGDLLDRIAGLLLGSHEHHRAAPPSHFLREPPGSLQELLGLDEVDDVDAVTLAEDETPHLRVPTARLVAESTPASSSSLMPI